jgi:site-specific DNA-methyltransferase (adenine-specific)
MKIVPREHIIILERQRKQTRPGAVNELKESIKKGVLLNAPVCVEDVPGRYLLVAGETRLKAIDALAAEGAIFSYNRQPIAPGEVPIVLAELETTLQQKEAELDENIIRYELTWQERAQALADIHALRVAANPEQTHKQTAEELVQKGNVSGLNTANSLRERIRQSILIAPHLSNPVVANARNANEARQLILKQEQERAEAILAKRRLGQLPQKPDIELRQGDLEAVLPLLDEQQFDLILADPPYGIGASGGGFRSRTVHHHNYDDTPEYARRLLQCILTEGFRISKQRANCFIFTDISHWDWLQRISAQIGWTPFRRPLIWGKSDSEGLAPWGASGPRITTDFIFFATKGQKGLLASPIDYIRVNRVSRSERIHAAEKPVELVRKLLECSTLPGDSVLDPCCGSGSTLIGARETGRKALGIEKDSEYFNTAMANVYGAKDAPPSNSKAS